MMANELKVLLQSTLYCKTSLKVLFREITVRPQLKVLLQSTLYCKTSLKALFREITVRPQLKEHFLINVL
jgi:hypothetical protein